LRVILKNVTKDFMIKRLKIVCGIFLILLFFCAQNLIPARYYRLLEKERKIFLGLRGIDSLAALTYLNLDSPTERVIFYKNYWQGKEAECEEFERCIEDADNLFAKYAPLSDDRIPVYVKYGPPSVRNIITPEKKIGVKIKEAIRDSSIEINGIEDLKFELQIGRFREERNLTRMEVYLSVEIEDTIDLKISRNIKIFDERDSFIIEKNDILIPQGEKEGTFLDEANFWLVPQRYRIEVAG